LSDEILKEKFSNK